MAAQEGWREAAGGLWSDLMYGDRFPRLLRILLGAVLLALTIWSGFLFREMVDALEGGANPAPPPSPKIEEEIRQLDSTAQRFRATILAREGSTQLAVLAATVARRPFLPPRTDIGEEGDPLLDTGAPPYMMVRAVMVKGGQSAVVVDIEGLGEGMILKTGSQFGKGRGKVVSISPEKVVMTWVGQRIEIPVDLE